MSGVNEWMNAWLLSQYPNPYCIQKTYWAIVDNIYIYISLGQSELSCELHFSQCMLRARLLHVALCFYVRSDLTNSAAVSPQLGVSSGGQTPFTSLWDFETSLTVDAWKAGDLGLTRQRMARVLKGLPHERERRGPRGSEEGWGGGHWHPQPV